MKIQAWPKNERPREKLLQRGPHSLSDAELLAIFINKGYKTLNAVDLARQALNHFGSLEKLLTSDQASYTQLKGLGETSFTLLQAALELSRRHYETDLGHRVVINHPDLVKGYLVQKLKDQTREVFGVIFLNTQHHILAYEEPFKGSISSANVYPREITRLALKHNASAVILAHNHPSRIAEPSPADIQLTQRLKVALDMIEVKVLDHIIIGDHANHCSLAEKGLV
jgi:DNA repair protein RadC